VKSDHAGGPKAWSETDLQEATDLLYGLPPSDFTSARNRLAKELKSRGRKEEARKVEGLSKPILSAWAVNQLAREHAPELQELVRITEAAADAHDGAALQKAGRERRQAIAKLVGHAKRILENGGHSATPTTLERISRTLQAASDDEQRDALLAGRLSRDLEPGGIDFLASLSQTVVEEEPDDGSDDDARLEQISRQIEEAEQHAARLTRAAEDAEKQARTLADQAADGRREVRRLKEEATALRRRAR
jgi:hypothetical protein